MKTKTKSIIAAFIFSIAALIGCSVVSVGAYSISAYNTAITLKTGYDAKIKANEADFDNLSKKISQTAQVSKAQLEKLKDIYTSYAEARTGNGDKGAIMNWVQESVPNVDTSTMNNLQNIIVSSRNSWTERQKELVDISREYNTNLNTFPTNLILGVFGFQKINPLVVSSENTQKAFQTQQDNNTDLNF